MAGPDGGGRRSTRHRIVEAALDEFTARGYEAATLTEIADRAGVTTGAIYAHFNGKLDLLLAAVGLAPVDELLEPFVDAGESWEETIGSVSRALAANADPRQVLLLDLIVAARRDPQLVALVRAGVGVYLGAVARATATGADRGLFAPSVGEDDVARALGLLNLGRVVFAALDLPLPDETAVRRVNEALLPPPPRRRRPSPLDRVRAAAAGAAAADAALEDGIVAAVRAGHSLREVGTAAGLSHERVRRIVRDRDV